jgi:hypothetical protein
MKIEKSLILLLHKARQFSNQQKKPKRRKQV